MNMDTTGDIDPSYQEAVDLIGPFNDACHDLFELNEGWKMKMNKENIPSNFFERNVFGTCMEQVMSDVFFDISFVVDPTTRTEMENRLETLCYQTRHVERSIIEQPNKWLMNVFMARVPEHANHTRTNFPPPPTPLNLSLHTDLQLLSNAEKGIGLTPKHQNEQQEPGSMFDYLDGIDLIPECPPIRDNGSEAFATSLGKGNGAWSMKGGGAYAASISSDGFSSDTDEDDREKQDEIKKERRERRKRRREDLLNKTMAVASDPKWTYPHMTLYILRKKQNLRTKKEVSKVGFNNFIRRVIKIALEDPVFRKVLVRKQPCLENLNERKQFDKVYASFQNPVQQNLEGYPRSRVYKDEALLLERLDELYNRSKECSPSKTIPGYQAKKIPKLSGVPKGTKAYALLARGMAV
jgi:hypothetical protein